jgi:hypothetical protein
MEMIEWTTTQWTLVVLATSAASAVLGCIVGFMALVWFTAGKTADLDLELAECRRYINRLLLTLETAGVPAPSLPPPSL